MGLQDWSYEKTTSAARTIRIVYSFKNANDEYERRIARLTSTQWSETMTTFREIRYVSERWVEDGYQKAKTESEWVTIRKETWNRDTIASVNGTLVKWCLENGFGLPSGDCGKYSKTIYYYEVSESGPELVEEFTVEKIDYLELLGSLNISDYGPVGGSGLSGGAFVTSQETLVKYEKANVGDSRDGGGFREYTKTSTSRWLAYGLTQEGQQAASEMLRLEDGTGSPTSEVVLSALDLKYDGTEVRTSTGRLQYPSRPSDNEVARDDVAKDDGDVNRSEVGAGSVYSSSDNSAFNGNTLAGTDFDFGTAAGSPGSSPGSTGTGSIATYDMPFAPDDYYGPGGTLIKGQAAQAAKRYAETMNALKAANAFGVNITTAAQKVPTAPLAPLYLNAGGVRVQTRMNGTAWAFGNMGLVVSSDLMLAGVVAKTS